LGLPRSKKYCSGFKAKQIIIKRHQLLSNYENPAGTGHTGAANANIRRPHGNYQVAGLALAMVNRLAATIDDQT
jgi:hypothetical protein